MAVTAPTLEGGKHAGGTVSAMLHVDSSGKVRTDGAGWSGSTITISGNAVLTTASIINLTSDVTGTLPVANGGTGVTSKTGTAAVVLSTSPTLVTPVLGEATATSLNFNSGTSNPAASVIVNGTDVEVFRMKLTSTAFNADTKWIGLGFGYSDNYMKAGIIAEAKDGNARTNLHICLNGAIGAANAGLSDSKMTVTYAGNVGIGTTSPDEKLSILDTTTGNQFRAYSDNVSPGIRSYTTADGYGLLLNSYYAVSGSPYFRYSDIVASCGGAEASQLRFFTKPSAGNPVLAMQIDEDGNVGINTGSPQARFHVYGTSIVSGTHAMYHGASGRAFSFNRNPDTGVIFKSTESGYQLLRTPSSTPASDLLTWQVYEGDGTYVADAMVFDGLANVGIGGSSPNSRLTVGGSLASDGSSIFAVAMRSTVALTGANGDTNSLGQCWFAGTITTQGNSETIDKVATLFIDAPTVTVGTGDTVTRTAALYLSTVASEGTNNYSIFSVTGTNYFGGRIGIQELNPDELLHITVGSTQAIECMKLEQLDNSEGFINYVATSDDDTTNPLTTFTEGAEIQGFMRVEVNGTDYWMPFYDEPTGGGEGGY